MSNAVRHREVSRLAMVSWIWYQHNLFFRRYGMQDAWTVFLNCVLLFVVLFYVFPLKFLTLAVVGRTMGSAAVPDIDYLGAKCSTAPAFW